MVLLLVLPLNAYWWKVCNNLRCKTFIIMATGLEVLALVFTYTRTGLVIGVVLGLLLLIKSLVRMTPLRVFAFLLALIVAWLALPGPYKERVLNPKQYTQSKSVQSRFDMQEAAATYAVENPVFGLGTGGFGTEFVHERNETARTMRYFVDYAGWQAVFIGTHNMYLQIASDTGFVGLFIFLCFFILTIRGVMRAEDRYREAGDVWGATLCASLFVSLIGFGLCAIFLHALTQKIWWMITAAAIVMPLYNLHFKEVVGTFAAPFNTESRRRNG
jgi:O-antigen ligase